MALSSQRKGRVAWLLARMREAKANNLVISKKKLVSAACIEFGAGNRYIHDLIQDLLNVETITESDGQLFFHADYLKELRNGGLRND